MFDRKWSHGSYEDLKLNSHNLSLERLYKALVLPHFESRLLFAAYFWDNCSVELKGRLQPLQAE
jgi:hypothetical protein